MTPGSAGLIPAREPLPAIEITDLVVTYGKQRAVNGLSLVVPRGSVYGLLGTKGAGKTTTIKAMLGFRQPTSGSVRALGYDVVSQHLEVCAHVGYVSEENSLYGYLTIPQLCTFCRTTSRMWNQEAVDRHLRLFDLPTDARVSKLSRGMRTQLALCLALGSDPDLLILDEPTAGLDPVAHHTFLRTLVSEIAGAGKTIFFSSHSVADVEAVADWVGILHAGKLLVSEEVATVKETHRVVRLIYEKSPPPAELTDLRTLPGVVRVDVEGRSVRLLARGEIAAIAAGARALCDVPRSPEIVSLSLEQIALSYYMPSLPR